MGLNGRIHDRFAETECLHNGGIPGGHRDVAHRAPGRVVDKGPFETIGRAGHQRLRIGVAVHGLFAVARPANTQLCGRFARGQEIVNAGSPNTVRAPREGNRHAPFSAAFACKVQCGAGRSDLNGGGSRIVRQLSQSQLRCRHHGRQQQMHLAALFGHSDGRFGTQNGLIEQGIRTVWPHGGVPGGTLGNGARRRQAGQGDHAIGAVGETERKRVAGLLERLPRTTLSTAVEGEHFDGVSGNDIVGRPRVDGDLAQRTTRLRSVGKLDGAATYAEQRNQQQGKEKLFHEMEI